MSESPEKSPEEKKLELQIKKAQAKKLEAEAKKIEAEAKILTNQQRKQEIDIQKTQILLEKIFKFILKKIEYKPGQFLLVIFYIILDLKISSTN